MLSSGSEGSKDACTGEWRTFSMHAVQAKCMENLFYDNFVNHYFTDTWYVSKSCSMKKEFTKTILRKKGTILQFESFIICSAY